jgi:hypothetical protein
MMPVNRLLVGVIKLELQERVEQELVKLSIPREAVIIEQAGPVELDTTLRDRVRPLVGGIQIFPYFCTLGFNAIRSGVSGFATNSHCTDQWFVVDGTVHHQPMVFLTLTASVSRLLTHHSTQEEAAHLDDSAAKVTVLSRSFLPGHKQPGLHSTASGLRLHKDRR